MKVLKITSTFVSARDHGPEEVRVVCEGHEFKTHIPRGHGKEFADGLGDKLQFARVQIVDHPTSPGATLSLDTRNGDGTHIGQAAVDFSQEFETYQAAKDYAKSLGFKKATIVRMRDLPTVNRHGHERRDKNGQPFRTMMPSEESL